MKQRIAVLIGLAAASSLCLADPGTPADSGFVPLTGTFYVNTNLYNVANNTEHPGLDIAANGNVVFGWENDGDAITDFESVWTVYDPSGNPLTPQTVQTNRDISGNGACGTDYLATTNNYLSFFRSDNTPIGGYTGWGGYWPKANRFGNGFGATAMCWEIGLEIPELMDVNTAAQADDFPVVQLLNNDGSPLRPGVISGLTNLGILTFTVADNTPAGKIRGGDLDYLANGNIVTTGQSQQNDDWLLTGQTNGHVPVYRIWTPGGLPVHGYAAVSSEAIGGDLYRGVGVTANGFALRWGQDGVGSTIRFFNNAGVPTSADISLTNLTGHPEVAAGGDGAGCGFHGNGVDAYVYANTGGTPNTPWVTVINADGTLRWSRQVQDDSDPIDNSASGDVDAAIDQYGRVVVTFTSSLPTVADPNVSHRYIQARLFDKNGAPLGPRFVVSEYENPSNPDAAYDSDSPRVAWRGNKVAFCWRGGDAPTVIAEGYQSYQVLASRFFAAPLMLTSASHSGTTTTLAWTGGVPPYSIQRKSPLTGSWSTVKSGISGTSTTYTDSATAAYYRVQSSN